jgi:4-aminobutyrate aminotransferase-like enzyme/Ser/Thr protein kinase RdoA (MazF antagonist)
MNQERKVAPSAASDPQVSLGGVFATPPPVLSGDQYARLLRDAWGVTVGSVRPLPSERDLNVLVDDRYVLKVANPAEDPDVLDMENAAMAHVRQVSPDLPIPALIPATSGEAVAAVTDAGGRRCLARLITIVPGQSHEGRPVTCDLAEQAGGLAARTSLALQGLFHRAGGRVFDWDVRRAPAALAQPGVVDSLGAAGRPLAGLLPRLAAAVKATGALPAGLNHGDVTLTNILTSAGENARDRVIVTGLIDFGDIHHTAHVCDLAATLTAVLRNTAGEQPAGTWELAAAVLDGYQRHRLLSPQEAEVLGDLVLTRLAWMVAISSRRAAAHPENRAYISQYDASNGRILEELLRLGPEAVTRRLRDLTGTARAAWPAPRASAAGAAARDADDTLLSRRRAVTGGPLSPLFYSRPLEVVRGAGPWLFAADGSRYLDAYNNVAVVGHAHPAVVQSVSSQLALLNTHSRYLHSGIVELAERILATMPDSLDTILFTTSGTEANELAWRMATACTGGNAAVIAEHAYHGSSKWLADLSSNEWPDGYRPAHVSTFAAPRAGSGGIGRETAVDRVAAAASRLGAAGDRAALLLADLGFTSEGILDAPADFVAGLVDGARRAGALFLADEVQSGFGRAGPAFWRFALAGITPDIVTLGKPMGAGYPIGAVITRREISDRLARDYEYFSTFAATPAAAAAGLAVLDILQQQALPEQAARVGEYLRRRLRQLARHDARLGEVRGTGLMAGVDVLGHRETHAAQRRAFARTLLDALRDHHVLAGLTGPDGTVLKVRPPLIWREEHADQFIGALEAALTQIGPS